MNHSFAEYGPLATRTCARSGNGNCPTDNTDRM